MADKVSILLPCRDGWEDTRACLEALRRHTRPEDYELLAFDNGSSDETPAGLARLAAGWPQLTVARDETNPSFAACINGGMRRARGRAFLWLNNDALPGEGWLEGLLAAAGSDPSMGAAGPLTGNMAPPEQIAAAGAGAEAAGRPRDAAFLGGFCFLVKREAVERVGLLDERFVWGWEDMDYCLRLRQAGYRLALAPGVFVPHLGNRSIARMPRPVRERTDLANRRLFLHKWLWTDPARADVRELFSRTGAPWDRYRPAYSVVVPCRGPWERVARCLESVRRSSAAGTYEVLAADCSGDASAAARLRELARDWPELWVLDVPGAPTLSRAVNRALRAAQGDQLVFLSCDAVATPGWLEGLLRAVRAEEGVGMAGPLSDGSELDWQHFPGPAEPTEEKLRELARSLCGREQSRPAPFLRGVALLVPRAVAEKVGDFDERFEWGCEVSDYCLRLAQAGYGIRVAEDVFIHRSPDAAPGGDGPEGEARQARNARLLFEKWAGHPSFLPQG